MFPRAGDLPRFGAAECETEGENVPVFLRVRGLPRSGAAECETEGEIKPELLRFEGLPHGSRSFAVNFVKNIKNG